MSPLSAAAGPPQIDWPGVSAPLPDASAKPAVAAPLPAPAAQAQAAARLLQEYLQQSGHDMKFAVDKATGMTIVRIYNSASGELVRQIPSEEIVRIAELLHQELRQLSVDVRV
jgi:flagellar protein FlaG